MRLSNKPSGGGAKYIEMLSILLFFSISEEEWLFVLFWGRKDLLLLFVEMFRKSISLDYVGEETISVWFFLSVIDFPSTRVTSREHMLLPAGIPSFESNCSPVTPLGGCTFREDQSLVLGSYFISDSEAASSSMDFPRIFMLSDLFNEHVNLG